MHKSSNIIHDDDRHKIIDDWDIISDFKTDIKIKQVTVYASYYICGLDVVYQEADLREIRATHSGQDLSLLERSDVEKVTLELELDEYINYISY